VIANNSSKQTWVNETAQSKDQLYIESERIDPYPGLHEVRYSSAIDEIKIIHEAHSRDGFALGAVLAAEYIASRKGIFTMKDVLGFGNITNMLNKKTQYAFQALMYLTEHINDGPVLIADISKKKKIPLKFLENYFTGTEKSWCTGK